MQPALAAVIGRVLGSAVRGSRSLPGGDINQAHAVGLADGREVFVKSNPSAPRAMFPAEARGLHWLAEARALRVPRVLAVSEEGALGPSFLALELIQPGPPARDFHETLGRGLAALHRSGAPGFGLDHDNFIGRLPQCNDLTGTLGGFPGPPAKDSARAKPELRRRDNSWAAFYRARRLEPQLKAAVDGGRASARMRQGFDRLFDRLPELVGSPEPPSRLHGDLWGGNLMCDGSGAPCLIDPAAYGGHREIDLAMMRLFGGFGERVFDAYHEAAPLADGHGERVPLYQLYPLLVHVNLFGGAYVGAVESALAELV
ncbi:MAG TPA: fructosamine kinase family protein [Polyangia bacterium]|nr:fructosamine kinase family protein [Polyangia bacterium]